MPLTQRIDFVPVAAALLEAGANLDAPALVTVPMPGALAADLARRPAPDAFREASVAWRPPVGPALIGYGSAFVVTGPADAPFSSAFDRMRDCLRTARTADVAPQARLRLFAGARFARPGATADPRWAPFGGWRVGTPVFLTAGDGDSFIGSVTLWLHPGATEESVTAELERALTARPPRAAPAPASAPAVDQRRWDASIRAALAGISRNEYQKVVLARSRTLCPGTPIDEGRVLVNLAERYPGCFTFKSTAAGESFLGATPELLCRVRGGRFETASLAGSRRRGDTPEADDILRDELLADGKERSEHAIVTNSVFDSVRPLAAEISVAPEPVVVRHANIQHLYTPIAGEVAPGRDVLDFVQALHPTPAVGGYPSAPALDAIARIEGLDRGWYAGPVGWVDADGDGEFVVALRSALIAGETATLYAGAGIVECSDPAREWAETELKFRPLMSAIDG